MPKNIIQVLLRTKRYIKFTIVLHVYALAIRNFHMNVQNKEKKNMRKLYM